ncbi:DUF4386 family protein [Parahaliea aestuarii]|uniref:DUF4386 family protein n=1 Tax=Parahaliea aestuarii TaxID=1852021 RepID=A0A5C8ZXX4_9GAMM|nr:DUF4386 family protein [Parahaliea aestuarii]TXS92554.1 DUF4386 family protein [Parahaliea aestuarii]
MKLEMLIGGVAAIIQALSYVVGFTLLATLMNPGSTEGWTQVQKLEFILERQFIFAFWNIVIYVVFGAALVVLAVVLHRLLQPTSSLAVSVGTAFGLIWAGLVIASGMVANVGLAWVSEAYASGAEAAAQTWTVVAIVQDGIGGGVEVVGGIWVLCISAAALRVRTILPKPINLLGLVVGVCGVVTIVPVLSDMGAMFGLLQIVWFFGVGVVLLRAKDTQQVVAANV